MDTNPTNLIHRYLIGEASEQEVTELERLLAEDAGLRRKFILEAGTDAGLREIALERQAQAISADAKVISPNFRPATWVSAAAAIVLLAALTWAHAGRPKIIAQLVSAEDASWESSLPTEPGSQLTRGRMKLTSGIATIRFATGAEMTLEAPAKLTLKGPKWARLAWGSAVIHVPDAAIGFTLETPESQVVDYGTSFAVNVAGEAAHTKVEVIEGEISVSLPETGEEVRLYERQGASIAQQVLTTYDGPIPEAEVEPTAKILRIGTGGRSQSVIRANKDKWLHPDKLLVKRKRSAPGNHDRRAFFSFDLSRIDLDAVASAQIRLNQVPSGIGYASQLPVISEVVVYGLTNPAKANWAMETTWEEAPSREDGVRLGAIEIPRSQQRGSRFFDDEALLDFLREHQGEMVTFILERENATAPEGVPSLVHAFASDTNPEASGPMLEFTLKN